MQNTEFDFRELKSVIILRFGNQRNFAEKLGIRDSAVSEVLNNKKLLRANEIADWADMLSVEPDRIGGLFFTHKVHET